MKIRKPVFQIIQIFPKMNEKKINYNAEMSHV